MKHYRVLFRRIKAMALASLFLGGALFSSVHAVAANSDPTSKGSEEKLVGGGYAVTGQIQGVGYTEVLYDATNGMPTSDANCVFSSRDGYIWVGGYSGILRYDGNTFERLDSRSGLTSGRCIFEDNKNRMWFGTNDNGVVMMENERIARITDKEGLPSQSIRGISQCGDGSVIIGTANGLAAVDERMRAHPLRDDIIGKQYIFQVEADKNGAVYGSSRSGEVFRIEDGTITDYFQSSDLGIGTITYVYPDPDKPDYVYLGTLDGSIYYGKWGSTKQDLRLYGRLGEEILGITSACDRIWINTSSVVSYIDLMGTLNILKNMPMKFSIEMLTADYQGNLWFASSRQGVMKVVSSNFRDTMEIAGMEQTVVNSTCMRDGLLYIGTDEGLKILTAGGRAFKNELTSYIDNTRIRCIAKDDRDNLWICCYEDNKGVLCYTRDNKMIHYTTANGLIHNETRCVFFGSDGAAYIGTNGGLSVIKNGAVEYSIGTAQGMVNTSLLTLSEGSDGRIYAGTDGNGIHVIENGHIVDEINRNDGLTSEVILRIKHDEIRDVDWIITSNSIQYISNGKIHEVSSFPYNNNFDLYYGNDDNVWVLCSYGIYCVKAQELLDDDIKDYKLYSIANGLPGVPTANSYSELDDDGTLYVSERTGVCQMNISHFFESRSTIILGVSSLLCDGKPLPLSPDGDYDIPKDTRRIQIGIAALDYTMANPTVHVFLEGSEDEGITVTQDKLTALEYTSLHYGNYKLHMQVIDSSTGAVYQETTVDLIKKPDFFEMPVVQIIGVALLILLAIFIVWRIMSSTVVRRQRRELRAARGEAEKANVEKLQFMANMSHELLTPLNTIMGADELLLRKDVTDVPEDYTSSVTKYVKDIHDASEELLYYVSELLDMSSDAGEKIEELERSKDGDDLRPGSYVPQFIAPEAEVLLVDESPMNRAIMRELLTETRIFVTTSASREDCLEKIKYSNFDVVILEPRISGSEEKDLLAAIHKMKPELPVYALTTDPGRKESAFLEMGYSGVLMLPIDPLALEQIIMSELPEKIMMRPSEETDV